MVGYNGSGIHLSPVAAEFYRRGLVLPAGYPVSIQTAADRANIAGYMQLGQHVFLDAIFPYVQPCSLISMHVKETHLKVPTKHRVGV